MSSWKERSREVSHFLDNPSINRQEKTPCIRLCNWQRTWCMAEMLCLRVKKKEIEKAKKDAREGSRSQSTHDTVGYEFCSLAQGTQAAI